MKYRAEIDGLRALAVLPVNKSLTNIQNKLIIDFDIIKKGPNTDLLSSRSDRSRDYYHFSLKGYQKFSDMWVESLTTQNKRNKPVIYKTIF